MKYGSRRYLTADYRVGIVTAGCAAFRAQGRRKPCYSRRESNANERTRQMDSARAF